MKKTIFVILGLLFIPLILVVIFVAIPLLLLFLLFLRILASRRRKTTSPQGRQAQPPGKFSRQDDVYDIECEIVDENDQKK